MAMGHSDAFLYERVAGDLASSIARGALRPGDRLPSVRRYSQERGVSVATVLQAYLRLESDGLIEVRPKSGHFVRRRQGAQLAEPRPPARVRASSRVSVTSGVSALIRTMREPGIVPLGAAYLSPELLPTAALNRLLVQALRESPNAGAGYDALPGLLSLRRQLARRSVSWGLDLGEDDFLITVGAMEALHLCLRAVARPGDVIAIESPAYFGVLQLVESVGIRAIEVPVHPRTGMDLEALDQVLRTSRIRAVVATPTVSNPLGAIMPEDAKEELVRMLARHDVPLIEDDVYGDLAFSGRPRPAKAFDRDGRVLLCSSVSKTLAPGYRIGWVVAGRYQEAVEKLKFSQTVATPTLTQMAVAEFLATGRYERHLRRLRERLVVQVERYREAIAAHFPPGTRVSAPEGGFVLWVEMPAGVRAMELQMRALEHGIAVAPGSIFTARDRFCNCVRISCGTPWSSEIERALATLGQLAAAEPMRASYSA